MDDFISRLKTEKAELDIKIEKLGNFLPTDKRRELDIDEQALLATQFKIMQVYSDILKERIFCIEEKTK